MKRKTERDIAAIWRSGQIAGRLHEELGRMIAPGITTRELDDFAHEYIRKNNAKPTFLGYRGFPGSICASINEEVVHGIPGFRQLKPRDVISIDVGVTLDGYVSDTAMTWFVPGDGDMTEDQVRLFEGTKTSLYAGIAAVKHNTPLRMVSRAVQNILVRNQLGIIRELTGHGVGFDLHEEPTVYNFDTGVRRPKIEDGIVIAIEPMASLGSEQILLGSDKWTYTTADGSLAAHFEHTVACWEGKAWILTDPQDEASRDRFGGIR